MGAKPKFDQASKQEVPCSAFIPYTGHVTENVIRCVNGEYVFVVRLQGAAHESADVADINVWHEQLNGYLRNTASPNVALWTHIARREYGEYPGGEFPEGFTRDLNERYRAQIEGETMLVNELYLSVVYRPEPMKANRWLDKLLGGSEKDAQARQLEELEIVADLQSTTLTALERYEPEILGCYEHRGVMFSEAMEFLGFLINGEWRRMALPRSEIREVLATSRPFFGKGGTMSLLTPTETQYGAALAIQEYPSVTVPGILNDLLSMPFQMVISQSFTFLSKGVAIGRMKRQQARMTNANDVAISQIEDIDEALDDLTSNRFVMGTHSLSILIRASDTKKLAENISKTGAVLSDGGMKWAREDAALPGAFWAQLPANFDYRVRPGDITSRNFAGFSSFHNYPMGHIRGNQWGDAVTVFRTTSGAPYYFNFHRGESGDFRRTAKLDPNHKDLANTMVIGKSGTGKTVLEMMLLAQLQKFHQPESGKVLSCVLFDKDLGASVGVRAMGGRYYPLKNGMPSGLNPFQQEPTPNNITFLENLIKQLVKHEGLPITPRDEREISEAVRGVMSASKPLRRISSMLEFLDPTEDNGLHMRLSKWCNDGPFAWLFDNDEDTLRLDECTMVGFDVTEFLDNEHTRTPTIMYLFHRIESLIDGRRIPIFMDEFWKLLDDPAFEDLAGNKLVTIRKQDGFLVMFTQSPRQVLKSKIAYAIVGQTATKIFLPNPEADRDDYVNGFKLTQREFEIVKSLGEKSRKFLIKQGQNSVVAELNLRGFEDELAVLSGNTATSLLAERLVQELGDDPNVWLPEFQRLRKSTF